MSTSQGSSPRERSITATQQCSGRWPGVWMQRRTTSPSCDLVAVLQRVVRVLRLRDRMDAAREAVLEREPSVPGDVVGVRVRLDDPDEPNAAPLGLLQVLLDRERRVDDDCDPGRLVADEVRRAAEVVVDELREDHDAATVPPAPAISLEVSSAGGRCAEWI